MASGSTTEERQRARPGDTLVDPHHQTFTRAVTIGADPCWVWEWIAQFGLGRAGFYSYELLERVVGIPVRNVEELLPHLQKIEVGDEVKQGELLAGVGASGEVSGPHLHFETRINNRPYDPNQFFPL